MGNEKHIDVAISVPRGITAEYFKEHLGIDIPTLVGKETQGNEVTAEQTEVLLQIKP